jgi:hypothetical protein
MTWRPRRGRGAARCRPRRRGRRRATALGTVVGAVASHEPAEGLDVEPGDGEPVVGGGVAERFEQVGLPGAGGRQPRGSPPAGSNQAWAAPVGSPPRSTRRTRARTRRSRRSGTPPACGGCGWLNRVVAALRDDVAVLAVAVQHVEVPSGQEPVAAGGQQRRQVGQVCRRVRPDGPVPVDGPSPGGVDGHDGDRWEVVAVEPSCAPGPGAAASERSPRRAERAARDRFEPDPVGEPPIAARQRRTSGPAVSHSPSSEPGEHTGPQVDGR